MGATLALGGVNPLTRERVVDKDTCRHVLAVITTAGLYEDSGNWRYEVDLPGMSAIGGGIIAVAPGKGGLATFAPLLDQAGNSVRGRLAARFLWRALGLDIFLSSAEKAGTEQPPWSGDSASTPTARRSITTRTPACDLSTLTAGCRAEWCGHGCPRGARAMTICSCHRPTRTTTRRPPRRPPRPNAAPRRRRNPWVWVSGVLALIAVGLLVWALAATSDRDSAQHELTSTQQQLDTTNQELDQTKEDLEQQQESSEASTDESDGSGGAVAAVGGLAAANRCTTT
jgi:hypothetical protein